MIPDGLRVTGGAALALSPVWLDRFDLIWQAALSLGGGVIVVLTVYKLALEIQIKRRQLRSVQDPE